MAAKLIGTFHGELEAEGFRDSSVVDSGWEAASWVGGAGWFLGAGGASSVDDSGCEAGSWVGGAGSFLGAGPGTAGSFLILGAGGAGSPARRPIQLQIVKRARSAVNNLGNILLFLDQFTNNRIVVFSIACLYSAFG